MEKKLTHEDRLMLAMEKLRNLKYKGLHTVYSGFNQAFREYFPGADPVAVVQQLVVAGKVKTRPAKGGALIFLPGTTDDVSTQAVLSKMGLK